MSDQTVLHNIRQRIGSSRQSQHHADLEDLHGLLTSLGLSHPYELEYPHRVEFSRNIAYAQGGRGLLATVPDRGDLRRLSSVKSVTNNVTELRLGDITKEDNNEVIWSALDEGTFPNYSWRPLSRYARGMLTGYRGITWWTSLENSNDIVGWAHRLGLYNIQIPVYGLILRCPVDYLRTIKSAYVPTVLDAFDQEVFHPTKDDDSPTCGVTISLENSGSLVEGADEFVLRPVPVEQIDIMTVIIDGAMRAGLSLVEQGPESWRLLETYYNAL